VASGLMVLFKAQQGIFTQGIDGQDDIGQFFLSPKKQSISYFS